MSNLNKIYGFHAVLFRLRYNKYTIKKIYYDKFRNDNRMIVLLNEIKKNKILTESCNSNMLYKLVKNKNHQGVVAIVTYFTKKYDIFELLNSIKNIKMLVLDSITDPHNLGACLRVADAAGVNVVISSRNRSAKLSSVVLKIASGAVDVVPYISVTNIVRFLHIFKDFGIKIIGTSINSNKSLYNTSLTGSFALVVGSEGYGIRKLVYDICDEIIYIPMLGSVESLNVSVATGICLFESVRQRYIYNN